VRHGGDAGPHRDGWGIGFVQDGDALVVREPEAASESRWVSFLRTHDLRSSIVLAHIRRATQGPRMLRNTQPFARELGGRVHLFMHNGMLPKIEDDASLPARRFRRVGDTDSEHACCALLDRLAPLWEHGVPSLEDRLALIAQFAREVRVSDRQTSSTPTGTRSSPTGIAARTIRGKSGLQACTCSVGAAPRARRDPRSRASRSPARRGRKWRSSRASRSVGRPGNPSRRARSSCSARAESFVAYGGERSRDGRAGARPTQSAGVVQWDAASAGKESGPKGRVHPKVAVRALPRSTRRGLPCEPRASRGAIRGGRSPLGPPHRSQRGQRYAIRHRVASRRKATLPTRPLRAVHAPARARRRGPLRAWDRWLSTTPARYSAYAARPTPGTPSRDAQR